MLIFRLIVVLALLPCCRIGSADSLRVSKPVPVANGHMVVIQRPSVTSTGLLIHFHGSPQTVEKAFARTDLNDVLAVVSFPGLSSAYSRPFSESPALFDDIQKLALTVVTSEFKNPPKDDAWRRVSVSSFSAGYGAVREILKTPSYFARIDAIAAADSIYAGLNEQNSERRVSTADMRDFLRFAALAVERKKTFVVSHSAQTTPYASTTETADYLLHELNLPRTRDMHKHTATMQQFSRASQGQFTVLGFNGVSGHDHMQHLHHIDLLWQYLSKPSADIPK